MFSDIFSDLRSLNNISSPQPLASFSGELSLLIKSKTGSIPFPHLSKTTSRWKKIYLPFSFWHQKKNWNNNILLESSVNVDAQLQRGAYQWYWSTVTLYFFVPLVEAVSQLGNNSTIAWQSQACATITKRTKFHIQFRNVYYENHWLLYMRMGCLVQIVILRNYMTWHRCSWYESEA